MKIKKTSLKIKKVSKKRNVSRKPSRKNNSRKSLRRIDTVFPKTRMGNLNKIPDISESQLTSGWKNWDKILNEFVGKKINIMEIGVYRGVAASWFLTNLMSHKGSRYYAVDTWEGSPEYQGKIDFKEIEATFKKNIENTGRDDQVVTLKMRSDEALLKLNTLKDKVMFDIIFIDASHEARDVLSDAILSWRLLKNGGVMIFDDYKWTKLKEPYFQPKLAIDSFVASYKPELDVILYDYQAFFRKKQLKDYIRPEVDTSQAII